MSNARKVGVLVLLLQGLFVGGWALIGPRSFYDSFPGAGHHWTAVTGPYNEHFVTDVGAAYLALAAVALLALAWGDLRSCRLAGAAWAVFSAPHFLFHARHLSGLTSFDKVAELTSLGATLVLAVLLVLPGKGFDKLNQQ
ncbi:hypothetical protein [Nocardioides marmorisolisilvae]|uniref:DUF4345 domain-containing protein n=1 Tax=Nocardioides marmorisolisilvae TaxID=1542737 RepID=A0A3N0DZS1_9ACTN|nr:hypothetical protein [Nocardioides marmorisolisilvae]RNL81094.1 hypothetical protein EFL95_01565 [Nocardioides marmorisolisilvae]